MISEHQTSTTRPRASLSPTSSASARRAELHLSPLPSLSTARPPNIVLGIRVKLVALMFATSFLIVAVLASYFPTQQISEMRAGVRDRAVMYGRLASLQLRPAVAFKDQQTAREVLSAIDKDSLVDGAAVFAENGVLLASDGHLSELAESARHGFGALSTFYLPNRVLVVAPVQTLEGPKGTFVLELSTRSAIAARDRLIHTALAVGAAALALGSLFAWGIARSLASRVESIAHAASAVAQGDLEQHLDVGGPQDEIGVLVFGFNAMVSRLRVLIQHIQEAAREESERLETLVQERTAELDRRNGDLRLVLDRVDQGFVTIDREASVVGERSRVIGEWLGPIAEGDSLWQRLDDASPGCGSAYGVAWAQLVDDIMPVEVSLAQMPERLTVSGRHLRFEYKPLGASDTFEKLLLVITDETAALQHERSAQEMRDILDVSRRLLDDRRGFKDFVSEMQELLRRITAHDADLTSLKRDLHTLKGNSALFGMSLVSKLCHDAESRLELSLDNTVDCSAVVEQWERTCAQIQPLVSGGSERELGVAEHDYLALLAAIRTGADTKLLARMVSAWRLEPLRNRLERAAEQLSQTVARLGKGAIQVTVDSERLYLSREELSEFWSVFAHVIRNAAVHGLESTEERERIGKARVPHFALRGGVERERLFVVLKDPGMGIDWEALRARAKARGLACDTSADLIDALFTDGVSTESTVSDVAGRGVGLGAVRAACERRHGVIDVSSEPGVGTTFRFSWPVAHLESLIRFDGGELS